MVLEKERNDFPKPPQCFFENMHMNLKIITVFSGRRDQGQQHFLKIYNKPVLFSYKKKAPALRSPG